jgi:hypothetical protein
MLRFGCSTYLQKAKQIIFLMQLVSYKNLSEINMNHRNNVLIVATGMLTSLVSVATMT